MRTITRPRCPFCKQAMDQDGSWWSCGPCRYDWNYSDTKGTHQKFDVELGDWACALNLYPDLNRTVVTAFRFTKPEGADIEDTSETRIEIPHCMTGITPQNVVKKLKFILVWS